MKTFKISKNDVQSVEVEQKYIIDNYLSDGTDLGFSVVVSHLDGSHPLMKNTLSNRLYYFLKGKGKFFVEDKTFEVEAGDMLVVPKNTFYKFEGKFDAVLISCPAFDPKTDVIIK